jgi:hypothetical protein
VRPTEYAGSVWEQLATASAKLRMVRGVGLGVIGVVIGVIGVIGVVVGVIGVVIGWLGEAIGAIGGIGGIGLTGVIGAMVTWPTLLYWDVRRLVIEI